MKLKAQPKAGSLWWLGDLVDHDKLFRNYPSMKDVNVLFMADIDGALGLASFDNNAIALSNDLIGKDEKLLDTLTHEIQHMIVCMN